MQRSALDIGGTRSTAWARCPSVATSVRISAC